MSLRARELDRRLVKSARTIKVMSAVSWPERAIDEFLASWRRGDPALPTVDPPVERYDGEVDALEAIVHDADPGDPLQQFVAQTAQSFATAARMLHAAGTPEFSTLSRTLYGAPDDRLPGSEHSHRRAADHLLDITGQLRDAGVTPEANYCIPAQTVRVEIERALGAFFGDASPRVVIDDDLAAKAAAGPSRVRIRAGTCFSEHDISQLIEHEGFIHSATAINGRRQPILTCMGLSSPRTTATQEGLATFAELATRVIDVARLRRLALRVVAIDMALGGADFVDVFKFFLEEGQSEDESAHSAMRVLRGGDVRGRIAFTKDTVYLAGLLRVHTFFRRVVIDNQPHLVPRLFAGRLRLGDLPDLDEAFADGRVIDAAFVPPWARDMPRLAAYLAFSTVANWIDLESARV